MFIIDALIGIWGFLYDTRTDDLVLAPVFDCGSSLYPQADDEMIEKVLESRQEIHHRIFNIPVSAIQYKGKSGFWIIPLENFGKESRKVERGGDIVNISEAETVRYAKIKNLICILQGRGDSAETDFLEIALPTLFIVGKKITVDGEEIRIGKKTYHSYEIKKVTINTEGSMALYDSCEKKICRCFLLNASIENIELLCVWIKKNNIPVEVLSGKGEHFFQYIIVFMVVTVVVLLKIMKIVRVW